MLRGKLLPARGVPRWGAARALGASLLPEQWRSTPAWARPSWSTRFCSSESTGGALEELVSLEDYEKFTKERPRAALWFTAVWCPPCRRIAPIYEELAKKHKDISFGKIDIDVNRDAAKAAAIMSVPTFMLYKGGELSSKFAGADNVALEDGIAKLKES